MNQQKVFDLISEVREKPTTGIAIGGATVMIYLRLEDSFYIEQILAMGIAATTVVVGGKYLWVKFGGEIADKIKKRFSRTVASTRIEPTGVSELNQLSEWARLVLSTYKGNRRINTLPIGLKNGRPHMIKMRNEESHFLISGGTGKGKSVLTTQIIIPAAMSGRYQTVVMGISGKDYQIPARMKNVHLCTFDHITDAKEASRRFALELDAALDAFNAEVGRRNRLATEMGVRDVNQIRSDKRPPSILFVIEELSNAAIQIRLSGGNADEFWMKLQMAAQFGRSANMHLLGVLQRPTGQVPNNLRTQMVPISFRTRNKKEAMWATGVNDSGAETLSVFNPDDGTLGEVVYVGEDEYTTLQVPFTTDQELRHLAQSDSSKFLGAPAWFNGRVIPKSESSKENDDNSFALSTSNFPTAVVTRNPSPPMGRGAPPVETGLTTGNTGLCQEKTHQNNPAVYAPQPLPAAVVAKWIEKLYNEHKSYADWRGGKLLTQERAILVALTLHAGFSANKTMFTVFGNKGGKYAEATRLVTSHYVALSNHWLKLQKSRQPA